jgi:hypothetical protein
VDSYIGSFSNINQPYYERGELKRERRTNKIYERL